MEWVKKCGGGQTQAFSLDVCQYIKLKPYSKIVGGHTFDALTKVSMPFDSMCPSFVAAVIKASSTRGSSRNGMSTHISEADLRSTMCSKHLPDIREAEEYMSLNMYFLIDDIFIAWPYGHLQIGLPVF